MKNITRKHLWPAALVAALAVVGMLAAFVVLTGPGRGTAEAQGLCATASGQLLQQLIAGGVCTPAATATPTPGAGGGSGDPATPGATAPAQQGICATASGELLRQLIQGGVCMEPTATPVPPTVAPTMPPATSGPPAPEPTATPAPTATATPGATGTPGPTGTPAPTPGWEREILPDDLPTPSSEEQSLPIDLEPYFTAPPTGVTRGYEARITVNRPEGTTATTNINGSFLTIVRDPDRVTTESVDVIVRASNGEGEGRSWSVWGEPFTVRFAPRPGDVYITARESLPAEGVSRTGNIIRVRTIAGADPVNRRHDFSVNATLRLAGTPGRSAKVTVLVRETNANGESRRGQLYLGAIGLDSATDDIEYENGEYQKGLLTVTDADDGERTFSIRSQCVVPGDRVDVVIRDQGQQRVVSSSASIICEAPTVPVPAPETTDPECYQIIADRDGSYPASQNPQDPWWSVRDQWWDDRRDMTTGLRTAQQGRNTIQALLNEPRLQLTVTACEEGPVYIRFLDSDRAPFDPGLRVLGLDSGHKLELNLGGDDDAGPPNYGPADAASGSYPAGSANWAHWYDHFAVRSATDTAGRVTETLIGKAGTYYQGKFRYFDPCPTVDHQFYVQVYESKGKEYRAQERISCGVDPAAPLQPSNLSVTTYNAQPGVAVLRWTPVAEADRHLVVVIDTATRRAVPVPSVLNHEGTRITGLENGKQYAFAVVAQSGQGASATYTVGLIYQTMSWSN